MKKVIVLVFAFLFHINCVAQVVDYESQILKAAEEGDVRAMLFVAEQYYEGNNMAFNKNYKESRKWYEKAAEQGSVEAEWALFWFDYKIDGTWHENTLEKAMPHLLIACKKGYIPAIYQFGEMQFTTENYDIAVSALRDCVKAEYPPAYALLGMCFYDGLGVEDVDEAMGLFTKAIDKGINYCLLSMALCYQKKENYPKAIEYYNKAIDENILQAYNGLAYLYAKGEGVKQDFNEAHHLIDIAISKEPGSPDFYDSKGEFYLMEGKNDKAKEMWNKVLALDPNVDKRTDPLSMAMNNNIDIMIPNTSIKADKTFVLIIANQEYKRVDAVPFANNDGVIFSKYCLKTLGIPEKNIYLVENATLGDMKYHINLIKKVLDSYNGEAKLIFYYAGHGIPDEKDKSAYLLPIDGYATDPTSGFSIETLYNDFEKINAKYVIVFLDACFSGAKRDGNIFETARGVAIKPKQSSPKGNVVFFSAAQGDETAYPYKEKGHGMFTYYLLKKLQDSKGIVTLGDLTDYVITAVNQQSILQNKKTQTPKVSSSLIANNWRDWLLY